MPPYKAPVKRRRRSSSGVARGSRGAQGLAGPRSSGGSRSYRRKARQVRRAQVPVRAPSGVVVRRPRTPQEKGPVVPRRPVPKKRTPITRPIGAQFDRHGTPKKVTDAQKKAKRRHEQNLRRAPNDPRLPHVPVFSASYLDRHPKQRKAVLDAYDQAKQRIADDVGVTKPGGATAFVKSGFTSVPEYIEATHARDDLAGYHAAARSQLRVTRAGTARGEIPPEAKDELKAFDKQSTHEQAVEGRRIQRGRESTRHDAGNVARAPKTKTVKAGGIEIPGFAVHAALAADPLTMGPTLVHTLYQTGRATAEDPGQVTKTSIRTAKESVTGIPQAAKMFKDNPRRALKMIAEDYENRYGSIEADPAGFRKALKEEYGLTPYLADAGGATAIAGRGLGAAARTGVFGRSVRAVAEKPRVRLQVSGGEAGSVAQPLSRNLFTASLQKGLDSRRAAKLNRRVSKAEAERAVMDAEGHGTRRVAPREGNLSAVEAEAHARGNVPAYFSPREWKGLRKFTGRAERMHGQRKGAERIRLLTHSANTEREARSLINRLDKHERQALRVTLELGVNPKRMDAALLALKKRHHGITAARRTEGEVLPGEPDELPILDQIIAEPDKYLTPNVREVADGLIDLEKREAGRDPDLPAERAQLRRLKPQAEFLGVERGPLVTDLHERLVKIETRMRKKGTDPGDLVAQFGKIGETTPAARRQVVDELERSLAEMEKQASGHVRAAEGEVRKARTRNSYEAQWMAEAAVRRAKAIHDDVKLKQDVTARLKQTPEVKAGKHEPAAAFEERVTQAAEEVGLDAPGYMESVGASREAFSLKAVGTGVRAAARSKTWSGERFRVGRQATDPEIVVSGLLRNAKRRFSWRFTANTIRQSAFTWSHGKNNTGLPVQELLAEMRRRDIDPTTVEFVNPRIIERRELDDIDVPDDEPFGSGIHPDDLAAVGQGLEDSRMPGEIKAAFIRGDLSDDQVKAMAQNRYVAISSRDFDELTAAMKQHKAGAAFEIVFKNKPARIMLGLANTSWLSFQILSNGFLSGMAGVLNPFDYVNAQRAWRKLTPDEKLLIEPDIGITHHHHQITEAPHLGSTSNRLVTMYRGWNKLLFHKQMRILGTTRSFSLSDLNPLDALFRVDEAQNNFFRRAVIYNRAKKAAYDRMGANWTSMHGAQRKLVGIVSRKNPPDVIRGLIDDADAVQAHARHLNDFLGDYMTYTATERATLARSAMFYGYLRFSLKFAFWTMPVKHPVMTSILSELGRMGSQEVKHLLGLEPKDGQETITEDIPTSMLAQVYFGGKDDRGTIPFGRMNPFLNSFTQMERPEQVVGLWSPLFQAEVNQAFHVDTFSGKDWKLSTQEFLPENERPANYYGSPFSQFIPGRARNRVLQRDLLSLAAPYRIAERTGIPGVVDPLRGPQYDDSTLFSPHPREFKDEKIKRSIRRSVRHDRENEGWGAVARNFLPIIGPQPTRNAEALDRELEKRDAAAGKKKKHKKSNGSGWGAGAKSSGAGWGAGAGFGSGSGWGK